MLLWPCSHAFDAQHGAAFTNWLSCGTKCLQVPVFEISSSDQQKYVSERKKLPHFRETGPRCEMSMDFRDQGPVFPR